MFAKTRRPCLWAALHGCRQTAQAQSTCFSRTPSSSAVKETSVQAQRASWRVVSSRIRRSISRGRYPSNPSASCAVHPAHHVPLPPPHRLHQLHPPWLPPPDAGSRLPCAVVATNTTCASGWTGVPSCLSAPTTTSRAVSPASHPRSSKSLRFRWASHTSSYRERPPPCLPRRWHRPGASYP